MTDVHGLTSYIRIARAQACPWSSPKSNEIKYGVTIPPIVSNVFARPVSASPFVAFKGLPCARAGCRTAATYKNEPPCYQTTSVISNAVCAVECTGPAYRE